VEFQDSYPLITTPALAEAREFYTRWFGFEVGFESSWFVLLVSSGERPFSLAFMTPDHPSNPPGPERFDGRGLVLTFQVADAAAEHARLQRAGLALHYGLHDEPWGQRRFMVQDPAGVLIDIVEQTEPAPGFWEQFG
jgi:catechol 2,3-dioxygenase-like lactoylglutathione lyase family enzyme